MVRRRFKRGGVAAALMALLAGTASPLAAIDAAPPEAEAGSPSTEIRLETRDFALVLDRTSQTLISLAPKGADGFDFAPAGRRAERRGDGYYHLGDLDLKLRFAGDEAWQDFSTAFRRAPVRPLEAGGTILAAADLTPTLGATMPLRIERRWAAEEGRLVLRFRLVNRADRAVEIGGLGIPMVFDNILTGRSLAEAHEQASFADPYIGQDAGFLQVTRLNGKGPVLLVLPERGTPFEAYKPILDEKGADGRPTMFNDATERAQTFEGFYDWMVASRAFAEDEWRGARQWNEPTTLTLAPGETRDIGLRFVLSPSIREIEDTLVAQDRPVAVGVPGYVLPMDLGADLFLNAPEGVRAVSSEPAGAIEIGQAPPVNGWRRYRLRGRMWGRARLRIDHEDGSVQTVHYFVTKPAAEAVADMGRFLTTRQWYDDPADPFGRGPSIMSYDKEAGAIVLQDPRAWIAGLSDEGGAGSWLAAVMKQLGAPDPEELAKIERFVTETLDGGLQINEGPNAFGVRKSLFFHDPEELPEFAYDPSIDWSTWASWDREQAHSVVRSFNYVHVAAAHWVLYRLARYHEGLVKAHDWQWYLDRAYETAIAMVRLAPRYAQFGQMEGDVYVDILRDLRREGMDREARALESVMRARAERWAAETYPFGSEMPWDSTGQPEVYAWMRHFGYDEKAELTREVILGYDPTLPHWGYNGNARRYWDFVYAGKTRRLERQIHHYGSSNNAIPLFDSYRRDPTDQYLLRVAYGGLMGSLSNIDREGFASAAFHANPDMMRFDGYSGDYGVSFFGHAYATASYLVDHPTFGWIGYGGEVERDGTEVGIVPRDSFRSRLFVAPAGLWLTLDAGKFRRVDYDAASGLVRIHLDPADPHTPRAYLNVETTAAGKRLYRPAGDLPQVRGAFVIGLTSSPTTVELRPTGGESPAAP
ncbi:DUF5695 domain-containing protein [Sphingosinicella sp. CPCC 101087]|uniref:DUF5695 domain-containing protein n=1 Tax=Sphingosinicella sp. CPCC 101087 TaxID=2497754 RepID=UPI00101E0F41|nr:DUF5695 domain-containing protein [Sphingosinicella sp. CPCC 101087]